MIRVALNKELFTLIDDEDFDLVSKYTWHAKLSYGTGDYYANATVYTNGKPRKLIMHRLIMGLDFYDGKVVDHIDHDTLNNQKHNLRVCSYANNVRNMNLRKSNSSGFKGVCKTKPSGWKAYIRVNYKRINLGVFQSIIDAAKAYDAATLKYFGEFAATNKMMGLY